VLEGGLPCVPAQLGVATCPCSAQIAEDEYDRIAALARHGMTADPAALLQPLEARMARYANRERFEEAAATRDRLAALARALRRRRIVEQLHATESMVLDTPEGRVELRRGRMVLPEDAGRLDVDAPPSGAAPAPGRDEIDELMIVARYLEQHATRVRLVTTRGTYASRLPRVASYEAVRRRERRGR
jgi:DNA polymerase-3 subunit epsilon